MGKDCLRRRWFLSRRREAETGYAKVDRPFSDNAGATARPNSGGDQVNVAPGLSAKLGTELVGFTYVELPLYTRVNGYQLVPKAKLSIGLLFHL